MPYPNPHGLTCPWFDTTNALGSPNIKWCEETLCNWISEPANTWSNLGYLIVALGICYRSWQNKDPLSLRIFGPIIIFMGSMSFFYHQSNFYGSQVLDFIGMFIFVGWAIGMNLIRMGVSHPKKLIPFIAAFTLTLTALVHIMYRSGLKFQGLILVSALIIVATEFRAQKIKATPFFWFYASLGLLTIALSFSVADAQRIWCDPSSHGWFSQGHAIWHWIAALAMGTIYHHYQRAERLSS